MFRFGACCSKFLILAIAISLLGNRVGGDDDAVPSIFSDAFGDVNHLLMDGALDYTVDSEGIITLTLQKYASSAEVKLVIPEQDAITFTAIRPILCSDYETPIGFTYAEGCTLSLKWTNEKNIELGNGAKFAPSQHIFCIKNGKTKLQSTKSGLEEEFVLCETNFKKNDESSQGGYLATFKLFGQYGCDFSVKFPPGYKIFVPPTVHTTAAPSKPLEWWDIVAICAAVIFVLVLVGIAVWCIYSCYKPVLPTTYETKPSAPTAVTCLPAQKVIKPTATTQPAPVSNDLKQGIVPAPPPSALPPSALPQESDDERFERRTRERMAKFKAATIKVSPAPAPILETASQRRPSAEFRRTLESRDETELAPNTVKLERYEREKSRRKRYEREKSRRMLKAVDEGDQPRKTKSSSTIEDIM